MDRSVCPAVVTLLPYPYSYSTTDTLVPATQSSTCYASRLTPHDSTGVERSRHLADP